MKAWKCVPIVVVFLVVAGFVHAQESGEIKSNDVLNETEEDDSDEVVEVSDGGTSPKTKSEATMPVTIASVTESSESKQGSEEEANPLLIPTSKAPTVPVQLFPEEIPIYKDPAVDFCDTNCVEPNCASCFGSTNTCCQKCCLNIPRLRISNDFCISNCETLECKDCHNSRNPCCLNCCPAISRTRKTDTSFCTENCPTIDCNGIACPRDSKNPCCLSCCSPVPDGITSGIMKDVGFCSHRCPGVDCEQCGKIQSTHFCCIDCCPSVLGALQRTDAEFLKSRNPISRSSNNNYNNNNNNYNNRNRNNNFEFMNGGVNSRGNCN